MPPTSARRRRSITDDLLPALDAVDLASRQRLNDALSDSTRNGVIAIVLLLVALVALVVASWVLFRRTRRILNVPVAVGAALVLVALLWSAFTLLPTGRTIDDTVDTSLRGADALSRARASAFDARRAESLTLVNRGNGAANEADWRLADAAVVAALDEACASASDCFDEPWEAYQGEFAEVRRLDNEDGDYDGAVERRSDRRPSPSTGSLAPPARPRTCASARSAAASTTPAGRSACCDGRSSSPGSPQRQPSSSASDNG